MVDVHVSDVSKIQTWKQLAQQLRVDSIRSTTAAGSGHPTSSMSAADLMAVLMTSYLRYDFNDPHHPNNDHLIFSKGHACPLLYSMYKAAGAITDDELLSLRKLGSRLEGHPVPVVLPWVDVATGSLGQGLPIAVGMAWDGKYLDKLPFKVWVLMGDSETAEGSVWEALATAAHYKLNNIIGIIDVNRLGQRGETALGWDTKTYADRVTAFGCHAIVIDGHNLVEIDRAYREALQVTDRPSVIIARTEKGHGVKSISNHDNWHGKPLAKDQAEAAIKELGGETNIVVNVQKPEDKKPAAVKTSPFKAPEYDKAYSTREAYGDALKALGAARSDVVAIDAEVSNSTYSDKFKAAYPDRFLEVFIAEQQLVAAAIGLAVREKIAFASTFAAFFSRAYDFIRMGAISRTNIRLCGSHAGVSIGADGPSQMALEDLAMMRAVHGSTVLYPSDATCTTHLVALMAERPGISYMRSTREKTPILYDAKEKFEIGGSKVLRKSAQDKATLVAAGITLHESIKAYDLLQKEGISVRVIDLYSIKPVDEKTLKEAARETGLLITVEDHWAQGGIGDAVLECFAEANGKQEALPRVHKIAVQTMPGSGSPDELLNAAGINAAHIVEAVKRQLQK